MSKSVNRTFKRSPLVASVASVLAFALSNTAISDSSTIELEIKEQKIGPALMELGQHAGVQIIVPQGVGNSMELSAVNGAYTLTEALDLMLKGSGLRYEFTSDNVVAIKADDQQQDEASNTREDTNEEVDEEITVTGSRLARNASEIASNMIVLDAQDLRASGESTLQGALRRLPQNVNGASEVAPLFGGGFNGAKNITGGSTINLRGLGSESTLVLVDGRRIGKSGIFGGSSDINGIALNSVERVEVILDGASAIYGSDAVGGVINIILKKDYEGGTVTYNYGKPQEAGFEEHQLSLSKAFSWDSGRVLVDFERFQRSNLDGGERPDIKVAVNFGQPSGVVTINSNNDALFYRYNGQNYSGSQLATLGVLTGDPGVETIRAAVLPNTPAGTTLDLNSITEFSTDRFTSTNGLIPLQPNIGASLIADQEFDSLRVRVEQELTDDINVGANVYYSQRNTYAAEGVFFVSARVPLGQADNPFDAGAGATVGFPLPGGFADPHYDTDQTVFNWNVYANGKLWETWSWEASAAQSVDTIDTNHYNRRDSAATTAFVSTPGVQLFNGNPFASNSEAQFRQLVVPRINSASRNEESVADFRMDGELFDIEGGAVRLALGGEWRQESLKANSNERISGGGGGFNFSLPGFRGFDTADLETLPSRQQRSAFAEVLLPLVSGNNALPGIEQLTISGAGRYDSYSTITGSDTTWTLGAVWSPVEDVTVKLRRSTSFVAPTYRDQLIEPSPTDFTRGGTRPGIARRVVDGDGNTVRQEFISTSIFGGNPNLKPETATSTSVSVEYAPSFLPGLQLSASWHETDYLNRLTPPPLSSTYPDIDFVALWPNFSRVPAGQPNAGTLVVDQRTVNASSWYQSGVDYRLHYSRDTEVGNFYLTANVATTSNFEVVFFPGEPVDDRLEDSNSGAVPARRYTADLGWDHQGISAYLSASTGTKTTRTFSNRINVSKPALIANLTVSYDTSNGDLFETPEWLSDTTVSFKILNVLDDNADNFVLLPNGDPNLGGLGATAFRAESTDPRGRMFHVEVSKQF